MKTILITGINGYLGSQLAKKHSKTYNIIGLEYTTHDLFRLVDEEFKVYESKYGIPDTLFSENKIDYIIHAAAFYGRNNESNSEMTYANMYLPQILLEKAIANSCSVFINTDTVLDRFTSSYSLTKKQFRDWLKYYSTNNMIKVINLEIEHFYGPGSSDTNFITLMTQKMLANVSEIELTKGEQNRDFLFIDDLLRVYDLILKKIDTFSGFQILNVGSGKNTKLKYILEYIRKKSKTSSKLIYGAIPYRNNELMESNNDITILKKLGWVAKISIEKGLDKILEFEKNNINEKK